MAFYRTLADLIVVVHFAFVIFVAVGLVLILIGLALRWGWVRNLWFRAFHLLAIGVVVVQVWLGVTCPLTTWESDLRIAAGQSPYPDTFIGYWVHQILFYPPEQCPFALIHTVFGLAVLASFLLGPPRLRRRRPASKPDGQP